VIVELNKKNQNRVLAKLPTIFILNKNTVNTRLEGHPFKNFVIQLSRKPKKDF
jgi:hypothetical protein